MARPRKQTVDYFPHYCDHKKTMFILEQKHGNHGYSFWFKLLEILGKYEGHFINLNNTGEWEFLTSYTRLEDETCREMLTLLAKLEAIDPEMWEHKIVWSQNFVNGVADAYRNRKTDIPSKPDYLLHKPISNGISDVRNPQTKLDETKEDESREDISSTPPSPAAPYDEIISLYHELTSLPRVQKLTDRRKKTLRVRWKQYPDTEKFRQLFIKAQESDFLSGRNDKWTSCSFDWLINEANMVKVLEGNYDNKQNGSAPVHRGNVARALRLHQKTLEEEGKESTPL